MKSTSQTSYTLIEKIKNPDDAEAWLEFVSIYQPLILKICRSRGLQYADATDVAQEVLSRVANAIDRFDASKSGATFRGWLYRITRNLVVDFFRRRDRNPVAGAKGEFELQHEADPSPEESLQFQLEFRRQLFIAVAKIVQTQVKPDTWTMFWLTEIERKSVEAVAAETGMTPGAIYVARSRVMARLKKEVQKRLNETADYFV